MAKVWGADVSKDYIVLFDGKVFYKLQLGEWNKFNSLLKTDDVLVLEQTGVYSLPWLFNLRVSVNVYVAHTTALKRLRDFIGYSKDDVRDAELLRKLYFEGKHIYPFVFERFLLRWHFFNYRRVVKESGILTNRLRAFLHLVNPKLANFKVSKRGLEKVKNSLGRSAYSSILVAEIEKLLRVLEEEKFFKGELVKLIKPHKDYEILKSFPGFSDIIIAGLVSTYWNAENFKPSKVRIFGRNGEVKIKKIKAVDKFVAYVMGKIARKQSGKKDTTRKESKRPYILGLFYPVYIYAGNKRTVLYPLWSYIREKYPDLSGNQRYIKFLDRLLRLVYLAVKNRWCFKRVVKHKVETTTDEDLKRVYNEILGRVGGRR